MKLRVAITAALLTVLTISCTVQRYPGDCVVAPSSTVRVKNKAFGYTPESTTPLAASC